MQRSCNKLHHFTLLYMKYVDRSAILALYNFCLTKQLLYIIIPIQKFQVRLNVKQLFFYQLRLYTVINFLEVNLRRIKL